jgi:hypothetical protein
MYRRAAAPEGVPPHPVEGKIMLRLGAAVIAMETVALTVAFLTFGWPVLLVGAPLMVGTVLVLLVVRLSEAPRRRLQAHRAAQWAETHRDSEAVQRGLMSGFFEIPAQGGPVDVPDSVRK